MALSRRNILVIMGGGTIVAATAGVGIFTSTRTPEKAIAPWQQAGGYDEPRRFALSYAILVPNPHNRQPWQVDLGTPDTVILYRDKTRDLPHTDPYSRQLTIGLGCFLEQMRIAATVRGYAVDMVPFPEGEDGPVAIATFRQDSAIEPDPLFKNILDRHSCKEPFADTPVAPDTAAPLAALAEVILEPSRVAAIRELTWAAHRIETYTPRTMKESVDLMRMGKAEINAMPDGIDMGGAFLEAGMAVGMLTRENLLDPSSSVFQQGVDMYDEMLNNTPAYAVVTTPNNSRESQLEAGRRWVRLNLTTTMQGLSLHPVSQALQEYPEMAALYAEVHKMLAPAGHTVQMLGRLGYGPAISASPRWPLEAKVI
ncbi:MAG: hypothetical protein ACI96P_001476 [Candidatus Azotimanducaceae bacterium]|jgi:hypothetical protein